MRMTWSRLFAFSGEELGSPVYRIDDFKPFSVSTPTDSSNGGWKLCVAERMCKAEEAVRCTPYRWL